MHFMVTPTCIDLLTSISSVCVPCHFLCMPVLILLCSNKVDEKMLPALQKSNILSFPKQGVCGILAFQ